MRRVPALAATAAGALLLASACTLPSPDSGPTTVVVGADLPLSGAAAELGEVHHNAMALRVRQLNQGRLADQRLRLELRVLDNRSDGATAAANLATLAADPRVAAIVTAGCASCLASASLAELSVSTISLDAADILAAAREPHWLFRLGPDAGDNADRLSQRMTGDGVETVGLVHTTDGYGEAGDREVSDAADRDQLQIVIRQRLAPAADESAAATAAAAVSAWQAEPAFPPEFLLDDPGTGATGPDAVVIWTGPAQAVQVAAALRKAGYAGPLYLDMLAVNELLAPEVEIFDQATLVTTATIDPPIASSPAASIRKEWFGTYLSTHGTYHLHSAFAADAVTVLAHAITRAGGPDRGQIREILEETGLDGFAGFIRFTPDQHSGLHPISLTLLTTATDRWR